MISLYLYFAFQVFQKRSSSTFENILGIMQMYVMHLRIIFGISAIYLKAAHKQNPSCPMQPLHHGMNTLLCFCFTHRRSGGTNLIQLYFHNLQFTGKHYAFLVMSRKSDWMNLGIQLHNVHIILALLNWGKSMRGSIDLLAECKRS